MAEIVSTLIEENPSLAEIASQSEQTIWANTYLLKNILSVDIKNILHSLGKERAQNIIQNAVTLPTPSFLRLLLDVKVESYKMMLDEKNDPNEREGIQELMEHALLYTNILVTSVNAQAEYLTQEKKQPLTLAIAQMVSKFRPKYPDRWPPQTDQDKQKMREVDRKIAARPDGFRSDALLEVEASVCRHAHTLSNEVCESRGLNPYSCQIKMTKGTETSGHMVSVIFEDNNKNSPVFIDGQNGFAEHSFEAFKLKWASYGWNITSAEASRFISENSISRWDSVKFL